MRFSMACMVLWSKAVPIITEDLQARIASMARTLHGNIDNVSLMPHDLHLQPRELGVETLPVPGAPSLREAGLQVSLPAFEHMARQGPWPLPIARQAPSAGRPVCQAGR